MSTNQKTKLIFQSAAHQNTTQHTTTLLGIHEYSTLAAADQTLFKQPPDLVSPIYALTTASTIFHPQGGGQPSDVGSMTFTLDATEHKFEVVMVRPAQSQAGAVLHFGHFTTPGSPRVANQRPAHATVSQTVDAAKRHLYSRLHTAGHVLGAATRNTLESRVANFDELKASHFPDSAACEFQGLIDGKYKPEVQDAVDGLVAKDAEVRIEWWTKADFRSRGLTRLAPDEKTWRDIAVLVGEDGDELPATNGEVDDEKTKIRVVNIVGAEVYPCGGTHVPSTRACGKVTVRKISRQKGNSRISYMVD